MYLNRTLGSIAAVWGIVGVIGLLSFAVSRVLEPTIEARAYEMGFWHYLVMVVWTLFMAYSEGYKGFQKGFSPRVASRCMYLVDHCTWLRFCLAPWFCLGFFHTTRRRQITVIAVLIAITLVVILFRMIDQPWRGILDLGVVVGLSWGVVSTVVYTIRFAMAAEVLHDPQVVDPKSLTS